MRVQWCCPRLGFACGSDERSAAGPTVRHFCPRAILRRHEVPLARAAKSHDVAERLPSVLDYFRNVRANVLPVMKETLAKRLWAQGDHDTAIGVLFHDAPPAKLVPARGKFVAMRTELFRVVKLELPDLARGDLNDDLNAWRVRQWAGGNSRQ